jgi:protein-S-isoprenylcysteine O-methyltransferase Ste14
MLLRVLIIVWPISEIALGVVKRSKPGAAKTRDRGSMALLWVVIAVSVTCGVLLQFVASGRMTGPVLLEESVASALLVCGLVIRWSAIITLGRFFNTNVTIHDGHRIIRTGLYRRVRHPSYSGLLLAFAGLGVAFGNWLSLAVVLIPIFAAVLYRIRVEEEALVEAFGQEYRDYRETSYRLIPWIY